MNLEIFTIDGRKTMQIRKNRLILAYLGPEERTIAAEKIRLYSAFRLRNKSVTTLLYLNLKRRKRMLELLSSNGNYLN